ncbi:MAG TPA: ribonuclease P protein component [Chitinophagaceae bacterium]|nr:ribonuclease P protein component [Chitinophagaceae bacterium]
MAKLFSYQRKEKLKSRKLMDQLFTGGKSVSAFPVKAMFNETDVAIDFPVKAGVGVSSRNFKKAVDRNRIKRLLREAYRLNKQPLLDFAIANDKKIAVFFLFVDKTLPDFETLQNKMPVLIDKLIKQLNENSVANT